MVAFVEIEHKIEISLQVECNNCSTNILIEQSGDNLIVTPCAGCLDDKYKEGLEDGKDLPF